MKRTDRIFVDCLLAALLCNSYPSLRPPSKHLSIVQSQLALMRARFQIRVAGISSVLLLHAQTENDVQFDRVAISRDRFLLLVFFSFRVKRLRKRAV